MEEIVKVEHLRKTFADVKAVDDISFTVNKGELFGFLGVNGAGKSTTINMMCTLFRPTAGVITIAGHQVGKEDAAIRGEIGVVWQNNCLDDRMTVRENLMVRAALYGLSGQAQKAKVDQVGEKLGLADIFKRRYGMLSGGQKRRCEIAAALVNTPKILFLDEPTTGLDPATRKMVWESIDRLREEDNMTVFLTTHYMEEAAKADHIAIIDTGHIMEYGTPFELKEKYANDMLYLTPKAGCEKAFEEIGCKLVVKNSLEAIPILKKYEDKLAGFEMVQGTMDDVFLNVTGKQAQE